MDGIFIAGGPPFVKRRDVRDAAQTSAAEKLSLIDLTPTILHLLGMSVPSDMDGRVLEELFDPAWRAAHPIVPGEPATEKAGKKLSLSEEDREEIRNRLRGMGYVS
jgi:arylsulfatase A-like enzyme